MNIRLLAFSAAAAAMAATASHAECSLGVVSVTGGGLNGAYDALSASDTVAGAGVRVSGSDDCRRERVTVVISADESNPSAFGRQLILRSGAETLVADLRIADRSSTSARRSQDDPSAQRTTLSDTGDLLNDELLLTLPAGQSAAPGVYTARVRLNADAGNNSRGARLGTPVEIRVRVAPFVGLAASSATTLNLGVIEAGSRAPQGVTFRAYSNTPYEIEVLSDNGWTLQRDRRASGSIGYEPMLSGAVVGGGSERSTRFERSRSTFQTHEFNAKVSDFSRAGAGIYSDWVTVRIRPVVGG